MIHNTYKLVYVLMYEENKQKQQDYEFQNFSLKLFKPVLIFDFPVLFFRVIVLHSTTRVIPMLEQLRKGNGTVWLVDQMASKPAACHFLFVPGKDHQSNTFFLYCNFYFVCH